MQQSPFDSGLLKKIIGLIDLTSLDNCDTESTIFKLIQKANLGFQGVHPASVCTFPEFGGLCKQVLVPSIKSAVVGGSFPSGRTLTKAKIFEIQLIKASGIDEIDIVLNRGLFFEKKFEEIHTEIHTIKGLIGDDIHLKVILETGDLKTEENIKKAASIAVNAGADFIKTSTGKTNQGATPQAVTVMCEVIREHYQKTGQKIGIKPSGGIRSAEDAILYYDIVKNTLGETWLDKDLFRIGASSLYDNLIAAIHNE